MGGMAAAARLAAGDHEVTIVEAATSYGGKSGTLTSNGFTFDTGPSLFTLPSIYRDLFAATGRPLEDCVELVGLDVAFGYNFPDGSTLELPGQGVGAVAAAMEAAFGAESGQQWDALMARAARMWELTRGPFLSRPLSGLRDLVPLARDPRDIATIAPWRTLRSFGRELPDPRARMILDRYATYSGSDPRRAPGVLVTIPYIEDTYGAWHVRGGLRRLAQALYQRVVELGVTVRFGDPVAAIDADPGVRGVRTAAGDWLPADVVVANADALEVYGKLLTGSVAARALRRVRRAEPSLAGFVLLLEVAGRTPGLRHNNVWFPRDYDAEFEAIFSRSARPVPDPTIYACVPDDPDMHPPGDEAWFILVNAPRHAAGGAAPATVDWDQPGRAARYADHLLDTLAARGTDLRARVRGRHIITPADLQRRTGAPGGAIYGTSSNGVRAAFLRPANRSPVPGLYLVGGSSHPGGGLPLVALSAQIVAGMIGPAQPA
jgi:phytoene desaturase